MSDPKRQVEASPPPPPAPTEEHPKLDDTAVRNLLDRAGQNVKRLVDEELASEAVGADLWNFRLQAN